MVVGQEFERHRRNPGLDRVTLCVAHLAADLVHAVYRRLAAMRGVRALRVKSAKPDIYSDAEGVGVEIASFAGLAPPG